MNFPEYFERLKAESMEKIMFFVPEHTRVSLVYKYSFLKFEQKDLILSPRVFVVEFASWLKKYVFNVKNIHDSIAQTIAFTAYKEINRGLTELFSDTLIYFNMVDVANLRCEVEFFENMAEQEFSFIPSKNSSEKSCDNFNRTVRCPLDGKIAFGILLDRQS